MTQRVSILENSYEPSKISIQYNNHFQLTGISLFLTLQPKLCERVCICFIAYRLTEDQGLSLLSIKKPTSPWLQPVNGNHLLSIQH